MKPICSACGEEVEEWEIWDDENEICHLCFEDRERKNDKAEIIENEEDDSGWHFHFSD